MRNGTLRELLVEQLRDMYNMENQLVKALPKMAEAANSGDLSSAFEEHLEQTRGHVQRLEQAFDELGVATKGKKCLGMEGLIDEGKEILEEDLAPDTLDAGIIGAAQKVEHYEIAAYGTARTHAQLLGLDSVAQLLEQTLEEEKQTDQKLTELAQEINPQAELGSEEAETSTAGRRRSVAGNGETDDDEMSSRRTRTRVSSRS
ncbi:MAG: ferritin-like domain-containing protein [Candidatus Eremiobacteraeota bacterium]|nr:ferritin-like domain-containing protein [Candidatus Eremiobacteraeota bacterium]